MSTTIIVCRPDNKQNHCKLGKNEGALLRGSPLACGVTNEHCVLLISNWASEPSPTLGCSIEISRDIIIFMCLLWSKMRKQNYVAKHAHAQGQFGAVKTDK